MVISKLWKDIHPKYIRVEKNSICWKNIAPCNTLYVIFVGNYNSLCASLDSRSFMIFLGIHCEQSWKEKVRLGVKEDSNVNNIVAGLNPQWIMTIWGRHTVKITPFPIHKKSLHEIHHLKPLCIH